MNPLEQTNPYLLHPHAYQQEAESEIGIGDIIHALKAKKWLILFSSLLLGAVAAYFAYKAPDVYTATALVAPSSDKTGAVGGGDLATMLIMGSIGRNGRSAEAEAVLNSRLLIGQYIQKNNLIDQLLPLDPKAKKPQKRTLEQAISSFKRIVRVSSDKKTGFLNISATAKDPILAVKLVTEIVNTANEALRDRTVEETDNNLKYLYQQLNTTIEVPIRQSIFNLIESQIKSNMIAKSNYNFAFKVLDPATIPERPSGPNRMLKLLIGLLAGFILASAYALIRYDWNSNKK